jgi:flavin reductase (DIM6/NTAB) family NADH-FMN oxidoreductase RutF
MTSADLDPGTQQAFRLAMRRFTASVSVITACHGEHAGGLTATAVSSLSMDPPLLLVCVNQSSETHPLIDAAGRFCVNLLAQEQAALAQRFAGAAGEKGHAKYAGVAYETLPTGSRALKDCVAAIDCEVAARVAQGSHTLFIGRVGQVLLGERSRPLLYADRGYARMADAADALPA